MQVISQQEYEQLLSLVANSKELTLIDLNNIKKHFEHIVDYGKLEGLEGMLKGIMGEVYYKDYIEIFSDVIKDGYKKRNFTTFVKIIRDLFKFCDENGEKSGGYRQLLGYTILLSWHKVNKDNNLYMLGNKS